MMTKDDGVSSSSDVVVVGIPVLSSGSLESTVIDLPLAAIGKEVGVQDVDAVSAFNAGGVLNSNATLQSLLASPVTAANPETIQIIALPPATDLITTSQPDGAGKVWQVIPNINNPEIATIVAVNDPSEFLQQVQLKPDSTAVSQFEPRYVSVSDTVGVTCSTDSVSSTILMPPPQPPPRPLPEDCPLWATSLKNCEKIGDSFRGYVESEVDLDLLLTFHKQQTHSFWGTRQSPSPAKPSTRLMWKSQYVPFDGIPFVNAGSRAVVQECQYGPRRKGSVKKQLDAPVKGEYRQTCPARIYIKKVRKFPDFAVLPTLDKKSLKIAMDKAFQDLKDRGVEGWGQERFYVQLPTEKAHEFHEERTLSSKLVGETLKLEVDEDMDKQRLHPGVVQKIRDLVSSGETRVYAIRKQLRVYVMKELCQGGEAPERHDLTLFPTVNDLKNHIHQALRDIENGTLPLTASTVNVEIITNQDGTATSSLDPHGELQSFDPSILSGLAPGEDGPMPETVTVTLTQNPGEDGHHIISRIETHLSDGTTQVSTTLTPETAQLLSRLHPGMFPVGSLIQSPAEDESQDDPMTGDAGSGEHPDMNTAEQTDALDDTPPLHIVDAQMMQEEDGSGASLDTASMHLEQAQLQQVCIEQAVLADDNNGEETGVSLPHLHQTHLPQSHIISVATLADEQPLMTLTSAEPSEM